VTLLDLPNLSAAFECVDHHLLLQHLHRNRDVNKAGGVKAKASKPRPMPETCKAKATDPRPRPRPKPRMRK